MLTEVPVQYLYYELHRHWNENVQQIRARADCLSNKKAANKTMASGLFHIHLEKQYNNVNKE